MGVLRIFIEMLADVVAGRMFHLRRLGLGCAVGFDLGVELGIGDGHGRYLGVDAQAHQMVVDELADLGSHVRADGPLTSPVAVAGGGLDMPELLGVPHIGEGLGARQDQVQRGQERLELHLQLCEAPGPRRGRAERVI